MSYHTSSEQRCHSWSSSFPSAFPLNLKHLNMPTSHLVCTCLLDLQHFVLWVHTPTVHMLWCSVARGLDKILFYCHANRILTTHGFLQPVFGAHHHSFVSTSIRGDRSEIFPLFICVRYNAELCCLLAEKKEDNKSFSMSQNRKEFKILVWMHHFLHTLKFSDFSVR